MKAMLFNEFGPPEVLHYEDRPDPEPGPDDLVIEVHAVSVNRVLDVDIRSGRVPHYGVTPPHIPGVDPSGVVVAIGDKVTDFAVGDRVSVTLTMPKGGRYGIECDGGDAELALAPSGCCVPVRAEVGFAEATVISRHGPVAYNLLFRHGKLKAGETALILGASGNLGSIGIQLARAAGATVIAAAGSADRAAVGADLGADHTVNYGEVDLVDVVVGVAVEHAHHVRALGADLRRLTRAGVGVGVVDLVAVVDPRGLVLHQPLAELAHLRDARVVVQVIHAVPRGHDEQGNGQGLRLLLPEQEAARIEKEEEARRSCRGTGDTRRAGGASSSHCSPESPPVLDGLAGPLELAPPSRDVAASVSDKPGASLFSLIHNKPRNSRR